jgi:16S rRNA (cytosine967-C5)-methyltransferase
MNSPRRDALQVFMDVAEEGAYANLRLKEVRRTPSEQAYVSSLVYTALEHVKWADYMLSFYVKPQKKVIRNILRLGVAELFFMDTPDHAAVNGAVELTRECGKSALSGLVNGVLRRMLREKDSLPALPADPVRRLSIQFGCPEWILAEWLERFGEAETLRLLTAQLPVMEIRAQWPFTNDDLAAVLPVSFARGKVDDNCFRLNESIPLPSLSLFREGKIAVQGEGAMAICRFMGDMRGKRVLDACAAPGGKSAYLWSLTKGDICLTCYELHPHRVELMQRTFARLHVEAECAIKDASQIPEGAVPCFDAVLLDAPCSGLGLIREKPDVALHRKEQDIDALCKTQSALLESCSRLVNVGGTVCYSTCTISLRENEQQVEAFLKTHPAFVLEGQRQLLPQRDGTGGFYMARIKRCI